MSSGKYYTVVILVLYIGNAHIFRRGAGELDPCFGEEGAAAEHKSHVDDRVHRVFHEVTERVGRRHVIADAAHRGRAAAALFSLLKIDRTQVN